MYRVAVIEDHAPVNDLLAKMVRQLLPDCEVHQYFEADQALEAIRAVDFDLVVSDVDLGPGSDKFGGVKIAKALDTKRIPLLVVSGSPEYAVQEGVFRALDAWDYLQKPIAPADFELQIRRAIAYRKDVVEPHQAKSHTGEFLRVPDLKIDRRERRPVQWKGNDLHLSMSQMDIVEALAREAGNAVATDEFYKFIASGKNKENLRVKISEIRREFKTADEHFDRIKSVALTGYLWRID
jgi:DNA-binding response OmpR family regulator